MDALTRQTVARLFRREDGFSRNRNFHAYHDPRVQRAARICRQLESLAADLHEHGAPGCVEVEHVAARPGDPDVRVRVSIRALACQRVVYLSRFELELLREDPSLGELLVSTSSAA